MDQKEWSAMDGIIEMCECVSVRACVFQLHRFDRELSIWIICPENCTTTYFMLSICLLILVLHIFIGSLLIFHLFPHLQLY